MEWTFEETEEYQRHVAKTYGFELRIYDRGVGVGQRRFRCMVVLPSSDIFRFTDLMHDLEEAKQWCIRAAKSAYNEMVEERLHDAAPDLLAACKAFVEAWDKSHQLEKTDVALKMAKAAIEKATQ